MPRDSLASVAARRAKGTYDEARWVLARRTGPPPSSFKRRVLRQAADRHALRILVETGTYKGDTVATLRHRFDRIVSIELSPFYAERARRRFAPDANVAILEGDSADVLLEVVEGLRQPALFWLDGHWSGGDTARGTVGSPVSTEVDIVLRSPYPHVVLIDDARCFDGSDGYPKLVDLQDLVRRLRPDAAVEIRHDAVSILLDETA